MLCDLRSTTQSSSVTGCTAIEQAVGRPATTTSGGGDRSPAFVSPIPGTACRAMVPEPSRSSVQKLLSSRTIASRPAERRDKKPSGAPVTLSNARTPGSAAYACATRSVRPRRWTAIPVAVAR